MQIESIEIRNYRLFRSAALKGLGRLAVFVGANGSGKSTLFDLFAFLKDALTQNVAQAVARRGGFRELVSRGEEGPIGITLKFRESGGRLATYVLNIANDGGRTVVDREVLRFRRGQFGQPWHCVDFSQGRGTVITNESVYGSAGAEAERKDYVLDEPSVLAIRGLGSSRRSVSSPRSEASSSIGTSRTSTLPRLARAPRWDAPSTLPPEATMARRWRRTSMSITGIASTRCSKRCVAGCPASRR